MGSQSTRPALSFLLLSALSLALLAGRYWATGSASFTFLPWNLFLAWVPYAAALVLQRLDAAGRLTTLRSGALLAVWLAFLPNAPYIVTDFLHLRVRPGVPLWFDVILLASFAWTGAVLGLASLSVVHGMVQRRVGRPWARGFVVVVGLLCGLGVYLGRFVRLNSWDLVTRPGSVLQEAAGALVQPRACAAIALFSALLVVAYANYQALRR